MTLGHLARTDGERRSEYGKRRKPYNEESFPLALQEDKESDGWAAQRLNVRSVRMRKPKTFDEILENRFWNVLYLFGYSELNIGRHFKVEVTSGSETVSKQIDVFAKDPETVVVAECKASEVPRKRSMQKDLGEFASLKKPIATAMRKHFGSDYKPKILWFMVTDKIRWSPNDLARAAEANIHVVQGKELLYFEEIAKKLGKAARYQFHAEYLARQKVPTLTGRNIPAVKTKIGGKTVYFFSARPIDILRIAFVNHRDLRDPAGAPAYQRLVNPSRLKEIGQFLNDGGFFPNTILLNFHRSPQFNSKAKDELSGTKFGELILPDRYKSCWVIDGQHRLYGTTFANENVSENPLFFIAFDGIEAAAEAETFVTINAKQTKVPRKLLAELDGEVKWNSDDVKERLAAIASRAVDLLNNQGAGPLESRVATPGVKVTDDQPLTLPSFQQAILQSKLIGSINPRTKDFLPGICWEKNSEGTLHRLVELLSWYFSKIESLSTQRWDSGKAGFLCSNFGISGHIRLLGEISKHIASAENYNLAEAEMSEIQKLVGQYLVPVFEFIEEADEKSFAQRFMVPFGSGGQTRYFFALVELIRDVHFDFAPDGFEEYIQTISQEVATEADANVRWIQTVVPEYVMSVLKEQHGKHYFEKGVPKEFQKSCQAKRIDDDVENQLPVEAYLDWIQIKKIADHKEHRKFVKGVLSIQIDGESDGRHIYLNWFDKFNEIRRISAHPAGRHYKQSDIDLLNTITKQLKATLPIKISEISHATVS